MNGSTWLVIAASVAVVNPARLAPSLPTGPVPSRLAVTAAGTALSGVVAVFLAWLGPGALDAIDVSEPTFRVAAGLVVAGAALRDLFVGAPSREPALSGWGAAVVPVAIPFVLRPELGILALSAGSVEGVATMTAGVVVLVAVATAVAAMASDGVSGRLLGWLARLFAAVALVAGIALTVEGILAV